MIMDHLPRTSIPQPALDTRLLWTLVLTTALAVGNVYYAQPLLVEIGDTFHRTAGEVGALPSISQLGYVFGLFFLTPLGDVSEKRRLLVGLLMSAGFALAGCSLAPNFVFLLFMAFGVGLTAVLVQIIIPFVASLSSPQNRGRNLGLVLSAALLGILASRTLSGFLGAMIGWRGMYFVASLMMFLLAFVLRISMPQSTAQSTAQSLLQSVESSPLLEPRPIEPKQTERPLSYPKLLKSVWDLFRTLPKVRAIAINGGLMYGALSAFWASLAFYMQSPAYNLGPRTAGAFGLIGAAGALAATYAGRHAERIGVRRVIQICIAMMAVSYIVMALSRGYLPMLIVGVIFLDLGAQAATVSNQTQLYSLHATAQTRLNTIYKMVYMIGGAAGSFASALAWQYRGWPAVCSVGLSFLVAAWVWEKFSPLTAESKAARKA